MRGRGYGTQILQLVLPKLKDMGISRVLLTCNKTNEASRKIIERAGGALENEIEMGEGKPSKLRYWITFPN